VDRLPEHFLDPTSSRRLLLCRLRILLNKDTNPPIPLQACKVWAVWRRHRQFRRRLHCRYNSLSSLLLLRLLLHPSLLRHHQQQLLPRAHRQLLLLLPMLEWESVLLRQVELQHQMSSVLKPDLPCIQAQCLSTLVVASLQEIVLLFHLPR
jgi:hypothetical protein